MGDLSIVESCNPDHLGSEQLINLNKKRYIAKIVKKLKKFQGGSYNFREIKYLKKVLTEDIFENLYSEDELYNKSKKIE